MTQQDLKLRIADKCIELFKTIDASGIISTLADASDRFVGDSFDRARDEGLMKNLIYDVNSDVFHCNEMIRFVAGLTDLID